ncbi:hypothetical protein E2562_013966 [Oryza meyeriana var. granulata]|uniref:Uncharacterized protein n=1 Tax=Oryza meyeriana var. granulata TaxID=110450 RepID=A0A6G1DHK2_9ORYZ|nr:hypothetical protein E2562_013966 [Oryza meyeriana var. granulata]
MASVGFGSRVAAAVAPASSGRRRPSRVAMVVAATRGQPAPAEEEKSLADFIFGAIFKKDQLVETDPLLNKVDGAPSSGSTGSRTTAGRKKPAAGADEEGGGGFNLGGLFAKKG